MAHDAGRVAYESYRNATRGVSLDSGAELPDWADLPEKVTKAFTSAANGALTEADKRAADEPADEPEPAADEVEQA